MENKLKTAVKKSAVEFTMYRLAYGHKKGKRRMCLGFDTTGLLLDNLCIESDKFDTLMAEQKTNKENVFLELTTVKIIMN